MYPDIMEYFIKQDMISVEAKVDLNATLQIDNFIKESRTENTYLN